MKHVLVVCELVVLIHDPDGNNTFHVNKGLYEARKLLLDMHRAKKNKKRKNCMFVYLGILELLPWKILGTTPGKTHAFETKLSQQP